MSSAPIVDRIRIIPRPDDFLDRNVGSSGEVFFNKATNSLRVYSGNDRSGFEIAREDLNNVSNAIFLAKATAAGVGSGGGDPSGGASVDVGTTAPTDPASGNLWLNTETGRLYIYIDDGDSSQWIQPAAPTFSGNYSDLTNKPVFATVATSGNYNDLSNKPVFTETGFDGSYESLTSKPDLSVYQLSADSFSGSYDDLTEKPTTFSALTLTGTTTLQQTTEILNNISGATGVVVHDYATGAIFNHVSMASNFTANFTNVPVTNNRTISVVLILNQGGTARIPSAIQIDGVSRLINWQGASLPAGNPNQVDIVSFTFTRISNAWTVLGSLTTYGSI
jgi:hypothetical protein